MESYTFTLESSNHKIRIDKYLMEQLPDYSRSQIQNWIKKGHVTVDGQTVQPSLKLPETGMVVVNIPAPIGSDLQPENLDLDIIYHDQDVIVINKPVGLVVHPAPGHETGTLVHGLLHHFGDELRGIGDVARPGIVHRLDKDTSGLMVVAKTHEAHTGLTAQFADHSLAREYVAFVWGMPKPLYGSVNAPIGRSEMNRQKMAVNDRNGRHAVTHYSTENTVQWCSQIRCRLETGRTHQIRVHMTHLGHSILGDNLYGNRRMSHKLTGIDPDVVSVVKSFNRQALHAQKLSFIHPRSGELVSFECELPEDMQHLQRAVFPEK